MTFATGQRFGATEAGTFMEGFIFDAIQNNSDD